LAEANQRLAGGDEEALAAIAELLRWFVDFYPRHIEKEDKHFFLPVMDYFSREEKDAMIAAGHALDSRLLHEEYEELVKKFELSSGAAARK
jgi:hemerythrin-like domain-containing protein